MATRWTLTFDCADPEMLARFWAEALGYAEPEAPEGFDTWEDWLRHHGVPEEEWNDGAHLRDPEGIGPSLSFLKVPEPKVAKNRVHLDVQVGGGRDQTPWEIRWPRVEAAVERLTAAGASFIAQYDDRGKPDHVVMADPEGNEFCVV
ncbi:MAG TPA: VOC family protein [Jiangellaceae bacterium]